MGGSCPRDDVTRILTVNAVGAGKAIEAGTSTAKYSGVRPSVGIQSSIRASE